MNSLLTPGSGSKPHGIGVQRVTGVAEISLKQSYQTPFGERGGKIGLAMAFAALFVSIGVYMPFFPVFLADRGFSPEAIGLAMAIPVVLRLVTLPAAGALSDRIAKPRAFLVVLGVFAALGFAWVGLATGQVALCLALAFASLFWNPAFPLLESYALRLASKGRIDYGRIRIWGSASFVAANLGAGALLGFWSTDSVAWMIAAAFAVFALCAAAAPAIPATPLHQDELGALKPSRLLVFGVLASAFIQASHALLYAFASIHWEKAGLSSTAIGTLWAVGVLAEIVLFTFATKVTRMLAPMTLIGIGGAAAVLRFGAFAFDPPSALLFPLQLLHGLTFGAAHLGLMALIAESTPHRAAGRAQTYSSTVIAILMGLATVAAGPLYAGYAALAYLSSALLGAIGALLALYVWLQPQRFASGGKRRAPS
jgi:MFS transporter, PPP family, 3-phenylpropionic acid transporter